MKLSAQKTAFTLVELLVVIAIIGTLLGLLLPAVQSAREASRSNTCRMHLVQLQKALTLYVDSIGNYPGYVEAVSSAAGTEEMSWAATILPYLEQQALYDSLIGVGPPTSASVQIMVCPSNPPDVSGGPASSYLANAGWIQNERPHGTSDCSPVENIANGVFFDRTRGGTDIRDLDPMCQETQHDPIYRVSIAAIQSKGDGMTNTLMLTEGLSALYWNYVGTPSPNKKWDFGFCWEQPYDIREARLSGRGDKGVGAGYRMVNGVRENLAGSTIMSKPPNSAFPSSNHPNGVNVAFVGGQVRFLRENVSALVYAQLMTSNRKRSDLRNLDNIPERELGQPGADDY